MTQRRIAYSAIVLSGSERQKLLTQYGHKIPEDFEVLAHHVTIRMGPLPPELKDNIGLPVQIQTHGFYLDDKVCATRVVVPIELSPFMKNPYPHITLAVNRAGGGKPMMSNALIANSVKADLESDRVGTNSATPLRLTGTIQEIPA